MGPTEKAVRDTATPGEALLVLARAIDGLELMFAQQGTNSPDVSWALPPAEGEMSHDRAEPHEHIELPADWDAMSEEERAAWLRVAADKGRPGPGDFLQDQETIQVELAGGAGAEFPKPSAAAKDEWALTAKAVGENYAPSPDSGASGTPESVIEWYMHGGPLWLAAYDHDYLMGLPVHMRASMVATVSWYAPKEAQLLGRDILRVGTEEAKKFALEDTIERGINR